MRIPSIHEYTIIPIGMITEFIVMYTEGIETTSCLSRIYSIEPAMTDPKTQRIIIQLNKENNIFSRKYDGKTENAGPRITLGIDTTM